MKKPELRRLVQTNRHASRLTDDLQGPLNPLLGPAFLQTYKRKSDDMQDFIKEAGAVHQQMESAVTALHEILRDAEFRALLQADGFATLPSMLTQRAPCGEADAGAAEKQPNTFPPSTEPQLIGGICVEVLELMKDFGAPLKIFALLREAVPSRQIEIVRLMIALDSVQFRSARVLIALTPLSLLTSPSADRKQFDGISPSQMASMETDLAKVSRDYLNAANTYGARMLNLIAATSYFDRLLNSPKMVRYLARNFGGQLEVFQKLLDFRDNGFKNRAPPMAIRHLSAG
ncbi:MULTISPECIES: plasmid partitioning protein RepB C-terminal domain-containing protein [unclassified Mesorhizobium]|uniref:plasmid partitioning protein RepB C-terminal domain-containing protein n=1 Tax=unclassified Mesorhizobium TaxID=325217 RepID=UPI00333BEF1F